MLGGKELNIYHLYEEVQRRGGSEKVRHGENFHYLQGKKLCFFLLCVCVCVCVSCVCVCQVTKVRMWGEIARTFNLPSTVTSASYAIRNHFIKSVCITCICTVRNTETFVGAILCGFGKNMTFCGENFHGLPIRNVSCGSLLCRNLSWRASLLRN